MVDLALQALGRQYAGAALSSDGRPEVPAATAPVLADIPMTAPLDNAAIDRELPSLPMRLGDRREPQRGKIREYVTL